MVAAAVLLWASAHAFASSPPRPCVEALAVSAPCVGVLLPEKQARKGLACLRADLPACRELARLHAEDLAAEIKAAKAHAAAERSRADALAKLLDQAVTPPKPEPKWWQSSEFVVFVSVVAVGALTAAVVLGVVD